MICCVRPPLSCVKYRGIRQSLLYHACLREGR
jgi:hypothetical protein